MKITFNFFILACLLFAAPAQATMLEVHEFYLDNGLQVIVLPNHKAPIVKHMVWYKVGSADDPVGKGGIAHLLEHLMFRGTKKVPDSQFNEIIERNGGKSNAFTSRDHTAYHQLIDVSRLEVAMALEADRMSGLTVSDEAFAKERDIVYQERQQRVANNSQSRFSEQAFRILWQNSPYSRPISGTDQEIMNLSHQDALDFYRRYYRPENAVLVLAGDIDVDTAKILAAKYYGKIKNPQYAEQPKVDFSPAPELNHYRIESFMRDIRTPRIFQHYIVPSIKDDPKAGFALMLFSYYLGESETSYLDMNLVVPQLAAEVSASYSGIMRGPGLFSVGMVPVPEMPIAEAEDLLNDTIRGAMCALTPETLEKIKKKMISGQVYIRDNLDEAAFLAGQLTATGLPLSLLENYEQNIMAVSIDDVFSVFKNMLDHSTSITAVIMPENNEENTK